MEYTEEMSADFQERADAFQKEHQAFYEELCKKHQCEMVYTPVQVPVAAGLYATAINQNVGDLKYKSVPSPEEFVPKG